MPRRKQTKRTTVKDLRTILRLAHEHGLSMRAISERLRLSKTSVATYLWRAREAGLSSYPNRSRLQLAVAMLTVLNRTAPNGARRERILIRVLFSRRNRCTPAGLFTLTLRFEHPTAHLGSERCWFWA
jgi:hypothetical protein